ncbi:BREX-1 system adenine-specific DNA-methyltransferase PglX [Clostridium muellerianum]|uniref:BREX-1 system adenine-specific DNA-methyltransferase PglX n=1 Tax=Clostridium muellerianum TaxID=2716538 RepID=UPI00315AC02E
MDKNKIKTFAIWARKNLIGSVSERANRIGVTENKIEDAVAVQGGFKLEGKEEIFKLSKGHRDKLVNEVREKGFDQVMEEAAYTWFNRFMGLRYMEVNDYLPSGIRVLSSEVEGKTEPDVLTRISEVIDELKLDAEYIYRLLDSGKTEDREEAYKHILVKQCNELGKIIPQMFEKISDYTELLLPDNLLEEGSVIRKMVEDIEEVDFKEEVEIIGWMYQYYISEKKDEVFAALKKNVKISKENIPAATQLFTPKWIVKYMVENSLGRLWLEGHPNEEIQKEWKYYLEEADQEPEVEEELKKIREEHSKLKPEDIKVLDPCMGSGHILVYAFDVLYKIYVSAGYSEREIPRMILQNNLYGLDIDDRAAQLASFALIMKARHYNRRLFREIERVDLELNLCSIQESNEITKEAIDYFVGVDSGQKIVDSKKIKEDVLQEVAMDTVKVGNDTLREDIEYLVEVFTDAKEYGSILEVKKVNFKALKQRLMEIEKDDNFIFGDYRRILLDKLPVIVKQAEIMGRKYGICVTNPPYLGRKGMSIKLIDYIDEKYSKHKQDVYSVFIDKVNNYTNKYCFMGMITQHSWMFLERFSELRIKLLDYTTIINMVHLGARAFEEISGEVVQSVAFVLQNRNNKQYIGKYSRLIDYNNTYEKEKNYLEKENIICTKQKLFNEIPNNYIAYWITVNMNKLFANSNLTSYGKAREGMATANNDYFLKLWYEVNYNHIRFNEFSRESAIISQKKWFPYNKGGEYRKWYGNRDYIVNWYNDGEEIRNFKDGKGKVRSHNYNLEYIFNEGIGWSSISSGIFNSRYIPHGTLSDSKGPTYYCDTDENLNYILGFLNSKISNELLKILAPTLDYKVGDIADLPLILKDEKKFLVNQYVDFLINKCKNDWDSFETSWDFKIHPLLLVDSGKWMVGIVEMNKKILITIHYPLPAISLMHLIFGSHLRIVNLIN